MGFLVFLIGVVKIQRSVFSLPFVSAKSTSKGEKERISVLEFFCVCGKFSWEIEMRRRGRRWIQEIKIRVRIPVPKAFSRWRAQEISELENFSLSIFPRASPRKYIRENFPALPSRKIIIQVKFEKPLENFEFGKNIEKENLEISYGHDVPAFVAV